jgi:ankyrin repeat protein
MATESEKQDLSDAIASGNLEQVRQIVSSKPMIARWRNQEQVPFVTLAVQYGYLDIVKFLVKKKASLNWMSPSLDDNLYTMAKRLGHESIAKYLEPLMDPDLMEVVRVKLGQDEIASTGVESSADRQLDDFSIFEKIQDEDIDSIREMIANGANVNIRFEDDITPLIAAAGQGNIEIVRVLVEAGADVNALDADFETALLAAKTRGFDAIERYLLPLTNDEIKAIVEQQMEIL